jgi:asparagine N-glycosylation enzyme membrane subunit Stt3
VHLKTLNGSLNDYVSFAITNPSEFTIERLENFWDLWGPMPPWRETWIGRSKFFWLIGIRSILFLLAVFGFIKSDKNPAVIFSILAVASVTLIHMIYFADPRFTYTIEPFAIILASIGLGSLFEMSRKILKPELS